MNTVKKRFKISRTRLPALLASFLLLLGIFEAAAWVRSYSEDERVIIGMDNEDIVYMGRWEKGDDGLMRGSFECGLVLRFTGTSIRINGKASGSALIAVDGGEVHQKSLMRNTRLFINLPEGEHTLEIYAGAQQAFPAIEGFSIDPGASTLPSETGKTVEFIGDSIMEGYVDPADAVNNVINSYSNSYAFLTGRALMQKYGARFNTVAFGGICIVERGDNNTGNDPLGMPERYFLDREYRGGATCASEREAAKAWDVSANAPDYIVINLGTNDVSVTGARVLSAMQAFLKNLRSAYQNAYIFVMTPFNGTMAEPVRQSVKNAADDRIILVDTSSWNVKAGSDGLHPSPAEHVKAAELLTGLLSNYLEADISPAAEATDGPSDNATDGPADASPEGQGQNGSGNEARDKNAKKGPPATLFVAGGIILAAVIALVAVIMLLRRKAKRS
jgi:lysophospholipase L1-like esterase